MEYDSYQGIVQFQELGIVQTYKSKLNELAEVKKFVDTLNRNRTQRVIVPVVEGLAYFEAEIQHTNECSIRLGEEYIIDTTNYKASKFLEREEHRVHSKLVELDKRLKEEIQNSQGKLKGNPIPQMPVKDVTEVDGAKLLKLSDDTIEIQEQSSSERVNKEKSSLKFSTELLRLKEKMQRKTENTNNTDNSQTKREQHPQLPSQASNKPLISAPSTKLVEPPFAKLKPAAASKKKKDVICMKEENTTNEVVAVSPSTKQSSELRSAFFDEED